jgi:enoyl-CoA hydratase/carnithine racemase
MMDAPLLVRTDADVCRLTLNRPQQGNALSRELVDALDAALDACTAHPPACLVIEGAGRHFCTGFDLSGLAHETDDSLLVRFTRIELLLQRVARAPFHTIAVAQGRVMGAGADLFAACAERLVVTGASFAFPGWRGFGLVLGSRRLATHVGVHRARAWIESGCVIGDAEALASGLATACVEAPPVSFAPPATANKSAGPLASATDGNAELNDASDLAALVRSAAVAGLQQRLTDYVNRQAQARQANGTR